MAVTVHAYPYAGYQTTEAEYSTLLDSALGGSGLRAAASISFAGMKPTVSALDGIIRGHRFLSSAADHDNLVATSVQRTALIAARLDYAKAPRIVELVTRYANGNTAPAPVQTETGVYELPLWSVPIPASALTPGTPTALWTRLRSPSASIVYVQEQRPAAPPLNSIRIW